MATNYILDADPADPKPHGYSIRLSLVARLEGHRTTVAVTTADELVEAKRRHALKVLELNSHEAQSPNVTSPPRELIAVHVGHRPVTRHGRGLKAVPYSLLVLREEVTA